MKLGRSFCMQKRPERNKKMDRRYREASAEVLDILKHTEKEKVDLIPVRFINYLRENAAQDYAVNLDYSKPINEMNIKVETKGILGTICRNWWWNTEQKQEYNRLVREKEIKRQSDLSEQYNIENLFERRRKESQAYLEKSRAMRAIEETNKNENSFEAFSLFKKRK